MKKLFIIAILSCNFLNAQSNLFPTTGNVGIGTVNPTDKLTVKAGHLDSNILLHSTGDGINESNQADLMLWASEPSLSYTGVGIGNNVRNWNPATSTGGISRISNTRGGSYIRLLNNNMNFNLVSNSGTDQSVLTLKDNGNVGIGIQNPTNKLTVKAGHLDSNILLHSTGDGVNESNQADLILWASEPSLSYTGVGIGNNVRNWNPATSTGEISRISNTRGGSYIRLLDNNMNFNLVSNSGTDQSVLTLKDNGNVGIGTTIPQAKLDVGSDISNGKLGTIFGRMPEGNSQGNGTFLGVKGYATQGSDPYNIKSFSIEHNFYGQTNSSINFFRGGDVVGGFITFNTSDNSEKMRINTNGNVGIGTVNPAFKLDVIGTIRAREVRVNLSGADFVFEDSYKLMPLNELEKFIRQNKHLPEIAPAKEMQEKGGDLGGLTVQLLQKIEELTLHAIEQNKEIKELTLHAIEQNKKIEQQNKKIEILESKLK